MQVIPIPDSGIVPALSVSEALKLPYRHAFARNHYIFRTFIMPSQEKRRKGVQSKLNPLKSEFKGKTVLLVDDTCVSSCVLESELESQTYYRTGLYEGQPVCRCASWLGRQVPRKFTLLLRLHPLRTFPCDPFLVGLIFSETPSSHPHIYGIDLATSTELVAYKRDRQAIAKSIQADDIVYLSLEDLEAACAEVSPRADQRFEVGVFCGRYVTPVSQGYLEKLEKTRGKPKVTESHNGRVVTVASGDSTTTHTTLSERSDVGLHNLVDDQ